MKKVIFLFAFFSLSLHMAGQNTNGSIVIYEIPDTLVIDTLFFNLQLAYAIGGEYEPDTLKFFYQDSLVSSIALPKTSIASFSESVTTPLHNGAGYTFDNGFGVTNDFGYYLKSNGDGTFQMNDWTQSKSGDLITSASFGNQTPYEFEVLTNAQDSFFHVNMNTSIGEVEVYANGIRLRSTEFTIDTSGTGIILNTALNIGDYLIIDID